jgi:hypothetical protein
MLVRGSTKRPKRVLKPFSQSDIALTAQNHMGVLKAAVGKTKVIQAMAQRIPRNGHTQLVHVGEIGQPHFARFMFLPENHLLLGAVLRLPGADPSFQSAAKACTQLRMPPLNFFKDSDGVGFSDATR